MICSASSHCYTKHIAYPSDSEYTHVTASIKWQQVEMYIVATGQSDSILCRNWHVRTVHIEMQATCVFEIGTLIKPQRELVISIIRQVKAYLNRYEPYRVCYKSWAKSKLDTFS